MDGFKPNTWAGLTTSQTGALPLPSSYVTPFMHQKWRSLSSQLAILPVQAIQSLLKISLAKSRTSQAKLLVIFWLAPTACTRSNTLIWPQAQISKSSMPTSSPSTNASAISLLTLSTESSATMPFKAFNSSMKVSPSYAIHVSMPN